jgi:two-component system chemotaxis response regulator CheB
VQDPSDAAFPEMPTTALMRSHPNHVVGLVGMPALFEKLVRQHVGQPVPVTGTFEYEVDIARGGRGSMSEMDRIGRRSVLACPDCHGVMWEIGSALRALDERVALARKLENEAHSSGRTKIAESWADKARVFEEEAKVIRDSIRRTDEIVARSAE